METFKSLFCMIVKMIVINIVLIVFFASAPLLYVTVPFWYFLATPHRNPADMFTIYMLTAPFACGFWMTVICHWHTVRKAQREGRLSNWRDTEGGMFCTVWKSFGFMVMGWFGSALAEVVFSFVFQSLLRTTMGRLEFFAMAPFAVFAPVWIVLLRRWQRNRKNENFIRRAKNDRELRETLHAISLQPKAWSPQRALTTGTMARGGMMENSVLNAREQAQSFLAQGKTVRAAGLMLKLIETQPTAANFELLADIYTKQGLFGDAKALYLRVVKMGLHSLSAVRTN